jgi:hypothetical protein
MVPEVLRINVTTPSGSRTVLVISVFLWPDHGTVTSNDTLHLLEQTIHPSSNQPMLHPSQMQMQLRAGSCTTDVSEFHLLFIPNPMDDIGWARSPSTIAMSSHSKCHSLSTES